MKVEVQDFWLERLTDIVTKLHDEHEEDRGRAVVDLQVFNALCQAVIPEHVAESRRKVDELFEKRLQQVFPRGD